MSVVKEYEELGPCTRRLTIEVPAPAVDAERGRVVRDIARKVQLPGFRKGKVPPKVVEKRFADDVEKELVERLVPRYLRQAEAEKGLTPLLSPQVKDFSAEPGEDMTFVAEIEVRPEIEIGELDDIELPEPEEEPEEQEIEAALLDLRRSRATWTEADRAAATGDRVTGVVVSLAEDDDGEAAEDEPAEATGAEEAGEGGSEKPPMRFRVEIGGEGVDEKISLVLTGAKPGGSVRVEELPNHDAPGPFRLEVETVEEQELPELDDELAAEVGDFDSVADLREAVETQIRLSKKQDRRMEREKALLDTLRSRHALQLPQRVVGRELERMMHETADRMMAQGIDIERAQIPWEKVQEDLRPRAEHRVHARLILDAIVAERDVRVDERELERILGRMAAREQVSSQSLRQQFSRTGQLDDLRQELRREQVIRELLGEEDPEAPEPAPGGERAASGKAEAEDEAGEPVGTESAVDNDSDEK